MIQPNKHAKATGTLKAPPVLVRVTEYRVDGQADVIRLITSLMGHEEYPAAERISFTRALHVVRRSVITPCGSSPISPQP